MERLIQAIFISVIPATAIASGSQIISLLWLEALVFFIVLASLFVAKFSLKQRVMVFVVYLLAVFVSFLATSEIPYLDNMYFINIVNTALPLLAWFLTYVYYSKRSKT